MASANRCTLLVAGPGYIRCQNRLIRNATWWGWDTAGAKTGLPPCLALGYDRCVSKRAHHTCPAVWHDGGQQVCERTCSCSHMRPWDTAVTRGLSHTAWWHLQARQACEKVCPYCHVAVLDIPGVQIGMPMLHMVARDKTGTRTDMVMLPGGSPGMQQE